MTGKKPRRGGAGDGEPRFGSGRGVVVTNSPLRSHRSLGSRTPSLAWLVLAAGMALCLLAVLI